MVLPASTRFGFDRKFLVGAVAALLALAAMVALGAHAIARLHGGIAAVDHRRDAQMQFRALEALLLEHELARRARIGAPAAGVPGEAERRVSDEARRQLARVEERVRDHPAQHADFARLRALAGAQLDAGDTLAAGLAAADRRRAELRAVLARMGGEETGQFERELRALDDELARSARAAFGIAALATLLLAVVYLLLRRERAAELRAARAEADAVALLERRVAERTHDLAATAGALERSESRLRAIFESTTDAILSVDEQQNVVLANPAAAAVFRCAREDLVGAPLVRFIPERFRVRHALDLRAFGDAGGGARTMGHKPGLVRGLRADGEEFATDSAISMVQVDGHRLYTVILRDVSERMRAEQALRAAEARLRRLLQLLPEAVFVATGARVSFVNEAMQRLLGVDEAALLGQPAQSVFHPETRATVGARLDAIAAGAPPPAQAIEERIVRGDGDTRTVEMVAARIAGDGDEVATVVVLRDVTALRRMQAELTRSQADLRRLVAAQEGVREDERRRIARELHDDLQQTLAAIRVDVSTAAARIAADAAEAARILGSVDQLAGAALVSTRRIVNDLRPRLLDDLGLLPALELLAEQFTLRTGVACTVDAVAGDCDTAVAPPAVATCLYRVAQEALNNVAKHARARQVAIEVECLPERRVALRVQDDGRGIADADRGKPESFGLLGMHERVRALGGTLEVRAGPDGGTTVEAVVPAQVRVAA